MAQWGKLNLIYKCIMARTTRTKHYRQSQIVFSIYNKWRGYFPEIEPIIFNWWFITVIGIEAAAASENIIIKIQSRKTPVICIFLIIFRKYTCWNHSNWKLCRNTELELNKDRKFGSTLSQIYLGPQSSSINLKIKVETVYKLVKLQ